MVKKEWRRREIEEFKQLPYPELMSRIEKICESAASNLLRGRMKAATYYVEAAKDYAWAMRLKLEEEGKTVEETFLENAGVISNEDEAAMYIKHPHSDKYFSKYLRVVKIEEIPNHRGDYKVHTLDEEENYDKSFLLKPHTSVYVIRRKTRKKGGEGC